MSHTPPRSPGPKRQKRLIDESKINSAPAGSDHVPHKPLNPRRSTRSRFVAPNDHLSQALAMSVETIHQESQMPTDRSLEDGSSERNDPKSSSNKQDSSVEELSQQSNSAPAAPCHNRASSYPPRAEHQQRSRDQISDSCPQRLSVGTQTSLNLTSKSSSTTLSNRAITTTNQHNIAGTQPFVAARRPPALAVQYAPVPAARSRPNNEQHSKSVKLLEDLLEAKQNQFFLAQQSDVDLRWKFHSLQRQIVSLERNLPYLNNTEQLYLDTLRYELRMRNDDCARSRKDINIGYTLMMQILDRVDSIPGASEFPPLPR